jgi:hypothetical protein
VTAGEELVFSCDGLGPDRPLDGVGVDLDAAVTQESLKSAAPGCGIADRLREFLPDRRGSYLCERISERVVSGADPQLQVQLEPPLLPTEIRTIQTFNRWGFLPKGTVARLTERINFS